MSRRSSKRPVNGILFVDKPIGMSSNQALQKVKWIYQAEKAGHGGTLDPFAEGALPILMGEATKFGQYYLLGSKKYRVTIQFGFETTTDDTEGDATTFKAEPDFKRVDWPDLCRAFTGMQMQSPPIYSALKVNGRKSYELARKGKAVVLEPREIEIYGLEFISDNGKDQATFDVHCSKGTYIRVLARDMARYLGSAGHATYLRRLQVGSKQLNLCDIEALETLKKNKQFEMLDELLLPVTECVSQLKKLTVREEKLIYIRNGNDIETTAEDGEYALYGNNEFFGVGVVHEQRLYPKRLCKMATQL